MSGSDPHLTALQEIAAELRRLRIQQARTMAMLLGMVRPMTAEQAARVERRLMVLDDAPEVAP